MTWCCAALVAFSPLGVHESTQPIITHLRPQQPYRAWAFTDSWAGKPYPTLPSELYPGTNLDLTPDAHNISSCIDENRRGIATLHWAYGPDWGYVPKLPSGLINETAAAAAFQNFANPRLSSDAPEFSTWAFGGAAIDEWNNPGNNSASAAAGFTLAKKQWPWTFTAVWVTGQDDMFTSLMLEGTFDLAVIEGYQFLPSGGSGCGEGCFLDRLKHAKQHGYIDRTIVALGRVCPNSSTFPG
eukprot:SAG31_NODE_11062_length_1070_cov_0.919670_1_plen_240_part_10